jgi:signal transduction histidine kinase
LYQGSGAKTEGYGYLSHSKKAKINNNSEQVASDSRIHAEFLTNTLLELLSNCRHGNATTYSVTLDLDTSHIRLVVSDNGTVFSGLPDEERVECLEKGFGLKKIEKHVTRFGGRFKLSYSGGFTVDLMIPIIKE